MLRSAWMALVIILFAIFVVLTPTLADVTVFGTAILDLGDDGINESLALGEIATTGDTNSIFTEPSPDKLLISVGTNWPGADTAIALAANGANCIGGDWPAGVSATGVSEDCTGTLLTAAQPNVTSLGTLTSLTVSGAISATGDLTLSASAGNDVLLGDDQTIVRIDGGTGTVSMGDTIPVSAIGLDIQNDLGNITEKLYGLRAVIKGSRITSATANVVVGISANARLTAANTQNLTNVVGLRGFDTFMTTDAGGVGIITGAAPFYAANPSANGATITNVYGTYIEALTRGTNNYGIYINTPTGTIADALHIVGGRVFLGTDAIVGGTGAGFTLSTNAITFQEATTISAIGGALTITAPTISGGTHVGLTQLGIRDTTGAFDVVVGMTSTPNISAARALTIDMGNVAHTLDFGETTGTLTFPTGTATVASASVVNTRAAVVDTVYQPSTTRDTLVCASLEISTGAGGDGKIEARTDAANPPTTVTGTFRVGTSLGLVDSELCFIVKANNFYKLTTTTIAGLPVFGVVGNVYEYVQ